MYLLRIHEHKFENVISNGRFFLQTVIEVHEEKSSLQVKTLRTTNMRMYSVENRERMIHVIIVMLPFTIILYTVLFDNTGVYQN